MHSEQIRAEFGERSLERNLTGPTYEVVSRLMRALCDQRITVPGKFVGCARWRVAPRRYISELLCRHSGSPAVSAAYKSASGYVYPLEKGFVFVSKPPMYIRYEEISVGFLCFQSSKCKPLALVLY